MRTLAVIRLTAYLATINAGMFLVLHSGLARPLGLLLLTSSQWLLKPARELREFYLRPLSWRDVLAMVLVLAGMIAVIVAGTMFGWLPANEPTRPWQVWLLLTLWIALNLGVCVAWWRSLRPQPGSPTLSH